MRRSKSCLAGLTLLELILSLVVMAIISLAVLMITSGAMNTSAYVLRGTDSASQVETALRRMTHNLRTCSQLTFPTTTATTNSFTIQTQPDPNNDNNPRSVAYSLSNGSLIESDTSGTTTTSGTLVTGVTGFSVTRTSASSPICVQVSITAGTSPSVTRTVTIYCRNL